jgi:hypothetical protein
MDLLLTVSPLRGVLYDRGAQKLKVEVDALRENGSPRLLVPWLRSKF